MEAVSDLVTDKGRWQISCSHFQFPTLWEALCVCVCLCVCTYVAHKLHSLAHQHAETSQGALHVCHSTWHSFVCLSLTKGIFALAAHGSSSSSEGVAIVVKKAKKGNGNRMTAVHDYISIGNEDEQCVAISHTFQLQK